MNKVSQITICTFVQQNWNILIKLKTYQGIFMAGWKILGRVLKHIKRCCNVFRNYIRTFFNVFRNCPDMLQHVWNRTEHVQNVWNIFEHVLSLPEPILACLNMFWNLFKHVSPCFQTCLDILNMFGTVSNFCWLVEMFLTCFNSFLWLKTDKISPSKMLL